MSRTLEPSRNHAVVIGGSIAGLCAARVLSEHYQRVTLYERDELPDQPVNRSAVPQGQHVHLLMARGADELEALFEGLLDDMTAANVPVVENQPSSIHFEAGGHLLGTGQTLESNFTAYVPSRGQLEWQIRRRVLALPNVQILHRGVNEPEYDPGTERVTGVVLDDGEQVPADLVVDASGRGSRLPVWLEQWGFERPAEETIKVGVTYASQRVRIPAELITEKMVVVSAAHDSGLGMGMLFHEDGIWTVTAFGVAKAEPPKDFAGIKQLGGTALPPHLAAALRAGEAVGEMNFHRYPVSKWRRYDKLGRFPGGIFAFGDAVVSLNPTYGQGVTMSTIQAANLRHELAGGTDDLAARLARRTARTTYPVWTMNSVADQVAHGAEGDRAVWYGPLFGLFDQFLGAAETDPVLAEWFLRRTSMLDSLWLTPPPRIIGRAMRHNVRAWLAERGQRRNHSEESVTVSR
ncbi:MULTISPECIES: NAD(P)/FAD-dependent oxidoreductase [unclassified Mycolicibacterium]|uniref:FAD-dependent oxidoreductase n=1 Tax=unclassified Mycolicibacterium TaxID=2636767 RepID=UPI0012DD4ECF|nr:MULTISPECIES: FAD-dependent monooxygenase [unclassified Mycolicibacterium]MUL81038.1 oxidoreductase [Mycolicibacterium sp. CBMA 329]MUL86804.1 oxidoreductase [Mycolicibacterium sp. CBMA 331]MUL98911.1 oxidoreductase [Mycolicibacterium sp. CBMA 334]MUM30118.1 oxidoreductase [Mycolicibacterium sp. CBMA 295]MUM37101.1 oxidoreductase [Mycolicibacterium sp. CBMA 247]